jgi:hypothetical protein
LSQPRKQNHKLNHIHISKDSIGGCNGFGFISSQYRHEGIS